MMKTMKWVYLVFGIVFLIDFLTSWLNPEETYQILFWEVNIWVYRAYRLVFMLLFLKLFIDQRKAENLD
jgi:hypothetical protein